MRLNLFGIMDMDCIVVFGAFAFAFVFEYAVAFASAFGAFTTFVCCIGAFAVAFEFAFVLHLVHGLYLYWSISI